jgi:hypothetical protein
MTLEGLLPFILLFIMWGASRILLKMAKTNQKEQATADQKPGFLKMMQQQFADLEDEDEDEEIVGLDEYFQPPHEARFDELDKETLIELAEESLQLEPATTGRETVSVSPPTGVAKPRPTILRKKPTEMTNRRKLQNAIIWAEILAPPVALRDQ